MKNFRKFLTKFAPLLVLLLAAFGFSCFAARRACDEIMKSELASPPRYRTQFVLHPERYLDGAYGFGFKPGWVVTYAPRNREYGDAFFVTLTGKVLTRGTPEIVKRQHAQDQLALKKFTDAFAKLDAAVQVGSSFSQVVAVLGKRYFASTNGDGSFEAIFDFYPESVMLTRVAWLTNGFSLEVSKNGIVTAKNYWFTQSAGQR